MVYRTLLLEAEEARNQYNSQNTQCEEIRNLIYYIIGRNYESLKKETETKLNDIELGFKGLCIKENV